VVGFEPAEQFQQLSSLTALRDLDVGCCDTPAFFKAADLSGIKSLSQLISLKVACPRVQFSAASMHSWARPTALKKLSLSQCTVQEDALAAFTQLRVLFLHHITAGSLRGLLLAVCKLPQLTDLCIQCPSFSEPLRISAGSTAPTLSTSLCTLKLSLKSTDAPGGCDLFTRGGMYPHLRQIDLQPDDDSMRVSEQQLQQLCGLPCR
jgi:hypothetical protein